MSDSDGVLVRGTHAGAMRHAISEMIRGNLHSFLTSKIDTARTVIEELSRAGKGPVVTNLGAGVRRINLPDHHCPKCNGKGYI